MDTERDRSSENRHQEPGSAEEPQRAGTSGGSWPDRMVPSWSVPPGLIAPQTARPETDVTPPDAGPITDDGDWPGLAPPAGWFLPTPANGPADSWPPADQADQADQATRRRRPGRQHGSKRRRRRERHRRVVRVTRARTGRVSRLLARGNGRPRAGRGTSRSGQRRVRRARRQPPRPRPGPAPRPRRPRCPRHVTVSGSASTGTGASRRSILDAEPVVGPTRALRGRPGGPGLPPRRPGPGAEKGARRAVPVAGVAAPVERVGDPVGTAPGGRCSPAAIARPGTRRTRPQPQAPFRNPHRPPQRSHQ